VCRAEDGTGPEGPQFIRPRTPWTMESSAPGSSPRSGSRLQLRLIIMIGIVSWERSLARTWRRSPPGSSRWIGSRQNRSHRRRQQRIGVRARAESTRGDAGASYSSRERRKRLGEQAFFRLVPPEVTSTAGRFLRTGSVEEASRRRCATRQIARRGGQTGNGRIFSDLSCGSSFDRFRHSCAAWSSLCSVWTSSSAKARCRRSRSTFSMLSAA
jgi:hypothetical protein